MEAHHEGLSFCLSFKKKVNINCKMYPLVHLNANASWKISLMLFFSKNNIIINGHSHDYTMIYR